jgi:LPS O-antigen subunit length determinant protein (WzzB/FepE family)
MPIRKKWLSKQLLQQDIESLHGLNAVPNYNTTRVEATPEALQTAYQKMLTYQKKSTEQFALYRASEDAARQAEAEFHDAIIAMKEAIRGQFGSDSDAAQAVGLKKKSDRKAPVRQKKLASD